MSAPRRSEQPFLPEPEFVHGLLGLSRTLARWGAAVDAAHDDPDGPPLVADDLPFVLALLGLASLSRWNERALVPSLLTGPDIPPDDAPGAPEGRILR